MTETEGRKGKERSTFRNEFGKCLNDLMFSRGIFTATALAEEIHNTGGDTTDKLIRQKWSDTSKPTEAVLRDIATALNLTYEEKARLSMSVFFGDEWRQL